jgi:hypothetical protein
MSYLCDALHLHSSTQRVPYNGLLQMTQSLIFLDPISDVVPIGHSIYKKKTFKFYIIVSFKTTIQYMYLTGS